MNRLTAIPLVALGIVGLVFMPLFGVVALLSAGAILGREESES